MPAMRTIDIDFDVHRAIEMERKSFDDSPNAALRRLLGLPPVPFSPDFMQQGVVGRAWASKGVALPHGTELRMEYNGRVYTGKIDHGEWNIEGKRFQSPSAAAGGVAVTKSGKETTLDGWRYWQVKRPGDVNWTPLSDLKD